MVVKMVPLLCKSKLGRGRNRMYSVQTDCDCTYTMKRKIDLCSTVFFANKGLDAINLGNILHNKYVRAMVPHDFKDQSVPIISYTYTSHISTKTFNYRRAFSPSFVVVFALFII